MPVKVRLDEMEFFISYFFNRLTELKTGYSESVENVEEAPEIETVKGELVRSIKSSITPSKFPVEKERQETI